MADHPDGPITRSKLADVWIRVASAVVLGPIVLLVTWLGGTPFAVICALGGMAMTWEWNGITRRRRNDAATIVGMLAVAASAILLPTYGPTAALGVVVGGAVLAQALAPDRRMVLGPGAATLYGGVSALALAILRADSITGLICIFWLFAVVWAGDVAAYFTGRMIGGPKLWPAVSPKKTWSGAIGGAAGALLASELLLWLTPGAAPVPLLLPLVLSVLAQAGDLGESALKRRFGAKDSSRLIPGHGGVMDRVDGLAVAAVAGAAVGILRLGVDRAAGGLILW